jgi:hypothetical protein
MELALATSEAKTRSGLAAALRQILLLIVLAYAIAYFVPACFTLASRQADKAPQSRGLTQFSGAKLHAELACASAPPQPWDRSTCNSLK